MTVIMIIMKMHMSANGSGNNEDNVDSVDGENNDGAFEPGPDLQGSVAAMCVRVTFAIPSQVC